MPTRSPFSMPAAIRPRASASTSRSSSAQVHRRPLATSTSASRSAYAAHRALEVGPDRLLEQRRGGLSLRVGLHAANLDRSPAPRQRRCVRRGRSPYCGSVDTDAVLTLLQDVADEVINPRFRDLAAEEVAEKNPGDLVTVADREAEALITEALSAAYPDARGARRGGVRRRPDPGGAVRGGRARVHRGPGRRHQELRPRLARPRRRWWRRSGPGRSCGRGSGSPSTSSRTSPSAARAPGATASGWRDRPSGDPAVARRHVTTVAGSGRALPAARPLELTWVCCGVDYPKLVEGAADYVALRQGQPVGPCAGLPPARGGRLLPRARPTASPTTPRRRARPAWSRRPTGRRTTWSAGADVRPGR